MAIGVGAIIGLVTSVLPKAFGIWERKQDNAQELAMVKAQYEAQKDIEETRFDMSRVESAEASYQASLEHDNQAGSYKTSTRFGGFLMDMVGVWRASIRPGTVSIFIAMYCLLKLAQGYALIYGLENGEEIAKSIITLWKAEDWAILEMCISYYFGNRAIEKYDGKHV